MQKQLGSRRLTTAYTACELWLLLVLLLSLPATVVPRVLDPAQGFQKRAAVDGTYSISSAASTNGDTYVQVFGDSDPALSYSDGWNVRTSISLNLTDGMEHVTITPSATLSFSFRGNALALIGTTGPNHGLFSVQIDDSLHQNQSSKAPRVATGQTLFTVQGLADEATHSFLLTHQDARGVEMDVDAVVVWGGAGTTPSPTPATATTVPCNGATATPGPPGRNYSASFSDSGGIGFPFSCPSASTSTNSLPISKTLSRLNPSSLQTAAPSGTGLAHTGGNEKSRETRIIAGAVGGGAGVVLIAALAFLLYRRGREGGPLIAGETKDRGVHARDGSLSSTPTTRGSSTSARTGRAGEMVELFGDQPVVGIAGMLGSDRRPRLQDVPPRTFDVMRPVRATAPVANPFFSASSLRVAAAPHSSPESLGTLGTKGSRSPSSDEKEATPPVAMRRSSSPEAQLGTSGSSSGHGHSGRRSVSSSMAIDPYMNRRGSVLSVRNPDTSTEEGGADSGSPEEELIDDAGQGSSPTAERSGRDSLSSDQQHSTSSHSHPDGTIWPSEQPPSFVQPVVFGGPSSSRRPISTLYEGDESSTNGEERVRHESDRTVLTPIESPFDTPQSGAGTGSLRPVLRRMGQSVDSVISAPGYVDTPSSVQGVQFSQGYFGSRS